MEVRSEADRKLAEEDVGMEEIKRNSQRVIDSMQSMLSSAVRKRIDAARIKKKREGDINEMKIQLSQADGRSAEAQKKAQRCPGTDLIQM